MPEQVTAGMVSPFGPILEPVADQLPPSIREQYLLPVDAAFEVVLAGQMRRVWRRPRWLWPVFWLLSLGDVLFPETGEHIPTTLTVTAARDVDGTPVAIWQRTFHFPRHRRRRYTSVMRYDHRTGHVAELQGPHHIFQEDAQVRFIPPDTIEWLTVESTLRLGRMRVRLPRRLWVTGRIVQRADLERLDTSQVALTLRHGMLGPIFGYEGTFRTARRTRGAQMDG